MMVPIIGDLIISYHFIILDVWNTINTPMAASDCTLKVTGFEQPSWPSFSDHIMEQSADG